MINEEIKKRRIEVLGDFDKTKYDLTLRQIPITTFIYEAALALQVDDSLIRAMLVEKMGVWQSRESQLENQKTGKLRKKHITTINAFFTSVLGRSVDIAKSEDLSAPVGIFATSVE